MKISLSVFDIVYSQRTQDAIKGCDLVFLLKGIDTTESNMAKVLAPDKCVELNLCGGSGRLLKYLQTHNRAALIEQEYEEAETIYQSLPKGVELSVYYIKCFSHNEEPIKITLYDTEPCFTY